MRHFVLVAVALAALAGAASAAAPVHVIQGDRNAGGIRIARSTPADVKQLFGPASSGRTSSASPQSCVRIWSALRLEVEFFSFESNPCLRGVALTVTVRSRAAWRTALGLRVGDSAARLRALYPKAPLRTGFAGDSGYWLVTRQVCAEVGGGAYPGLLARMQRSRVSALVARSSVCD
jgi:hypothetical protein